MKKILFLALVLCAILALVLPDDSADAQTFGNASTFTGTTNSAQFTSNLFYVVLPAKTVTIGSISSTNENFTNSFYTIFPGTTNLYFLYAYTNSFASGTNGGAWSTNTPTQAVSFTLPLYMQAGIGTNTNTIYVP